ncbi:MFS transporter [Amycolatopsis sp. NPDC098790]|uniref:MFS transporter n=1 Tax=Amycolatopsis sp. NPDC098790 TaxID=3363939 RepID=UPI0037FE634F
MTELSVAAGRERTEPVVKVLAWDNLLGSLGQYSVVPALGVLIATQDPGAGPGAVGAGLFLYFATVGLASLVVNRWVARFRYRTTLWVSWALATAGFALLALLHTFALLVAALLLAGFGVSVHHVLARVLIAERTTGDVERNRAYSWMNVALNVGGAAGPFIASLLYVAGDARPLMVAVAVCYLLASAVLIRWLPADLRPAPTPTAWPLNRAGLKVVLRHPVAWRTVVVATLATFLYAQFYSAFALLVAERIAAPLMRAVLLSGPAIAIVVLQSAVTGVVTSLMRRGARPMPLLGGATVVFGISMVSLGSGLPVLSACLLAVALFALAEMVFTPMLNTAFAALPFPTSLERLNFRQVCWTAGEALGSLCGGTLFLVLAARELDRFYWLGLAVVSIAGTVLLLVTRPRTASRSAS